MKFKPSLRYFLLKTKALLLYRDYLKAISRIPSLELKEESLEELRREFEKYKDIGDESQWEFLLAEGRSRLPLIKEMLNRVI